MKKIYYELLPQNLQSTYTEIEEDMIFSNLSLGYYYESYKEAVGEENCNMVIAALAGDKAFLTYEKKNVEAIKTLIYVDSVSNFRAPLSEELDFFAYSIDYLLKKAEIREYDDFMIANCLSFFLELRNIPCSIALADHDGKKVFCNLILTGDEHVKVFIRQREVISYPYEESLNREFVESMLARITEGGE